MKEAQVLFKQINDDLNMGNKQMSRHCELLTQYGKHICELCGINEDLVSHVAMLEEEGHVHKAQVNGLVNSVDELHATINSMMN